MPRWRAKGTGGAGSIGGIQVPTSNFTSRKDHSRIRRLEVSDITSVLCGSGLALPPELSLYLQHARQLFSSRFAALPIDDRNGTFDGTDIPGAPRSTDVEHTLRFRETTAVFEYVRAPKTIKAHVLRMIDHDRPDAKMITNVSTCLNGEI